MDRILQGRVARVETRAYEDGNDKPQEFINWKSAPSQQQGLFEHGKLHAFYRHVNCDCRPEVAVKYFADLGQRKPGRRDILKGHP